MNEKTGHSRLYFWLRELPYAIVWILTVFGVGYTSFAKQALIAYWQVLAVIIGVLCVITGWRYAPDWHARLRLIITQVLHWLAILVAMNLILLPTVQNMLNVDATGLAILMLLALGTFIAGVHTFDWQVSLLGAVMALCVPGIAWIERSALLVMLIIVAIIGIGLALWSRLRGLWRRPAAP
jgi:hypothetical protein